MGPLLEVGMQFQLVEDGSDTGIGKSVQKHGYGAIGHSQRFDETLVD